MTESDVGGEEKKDDIRCKKVGERTERKRERRVRHEGREKEIVSEESGRRRNAEY